MEARLAEIRRSYLDSLCEKREAIYSCWRELSQQWNTETYRKLFMIVHSLAGSAETFGFAEVSATARVLMEQLRPLADGDVSIQPSLAMAKMQADYEQLLASLKLTQAD